jgi:hypothetical protein
MPPRALVPVTGDVGGGLGAVGEAVVGSRGVDRHFPGGGGVAGRRGFFFLDIDNDAAEPPCRGAEVRASVGL